jgi:hypothetical protein
MALARRKKRSVKTSEESWAEIFEDWKRSGLSAEEFCERNNYSVYGFNHFYKKQFGMSPEVVREGPTTEAEPLFVPFSVARPLEQVHQKAACIQSNKIEISTQNFVVRVERDFDFDALRQVLEVLGGMSC